MQCGRLAELPAIQWKLQNHAKLKRSSPGKHAPQADELPDPLYVGEWGMLDSA
jgi:hypothetical protein